MGIQLTSRKLSAPERAQRYWPAFERVAAYALDVQSGLGAKSYGLTRNQAERRALTNLKAMMKARQTVRTRHVE